MKWSPEAQEAIRKVPFFVRRRVRARVEEDAARAGKKMVTLAELKATQARYLSSMASEIKGYQVEACFGPAGCPHRAVAGDALLESIESLMKKEDLPALLRQRVKGDLKFHHEFRIALADCPNACSQPQIKDIGIIGACTPCLTGEPCSRCEACLEACRENAIVLDDNPPAPRIDFSGCLHCGKCIQVCPTGTLGEGARGFRVQLGGKLGRHPQLGRELPGIYSQQQVLQIVETCLGLYKQRSRRGERFGQILSSADFKALAERFSG